MLVRKARSSSPRRYTWAAVLACLAFFSCAKAPDPNAGKIPYDGGVGTGPDWDQDVAEVELTVDPGRLGRPISPLIYGHNSANAAAARNGLGALRLGGNRLTAYNWENNASNAGSDYMFQSDNYLVQSSTTGDVPGDAVRATLDKARELGAAAVVTVPIVDYVAADKDQPGDVRDSGADYLTTRFKRNVASSDGAPATAPDISDGAVYQDAFVAWSRATFPDVPILYSLDNEPDLWSGTHAEVHPMPVTYEELVARNIDFATAIKNVSPEAPVVGFVSYGWQGFVSLQNAPDARGRGDFVSYYLKQMKAAEDTAGRRLIDYMDLHWYPEAQGPDDSGTPTRIVFGGGGGAMPAGVVAARVQAPRSLWDPNYLESSWIAGLAGPIALIPRMQQKIDASYPGTELAITEWNYGGGTHVSGAVATADVLGIFGREGVGLANMWPAGGDSYNLAAFRAYRNYDGGGAKFGDQGVFATTSSIRSTSVYAAVDSANPGRLTIVAINKRDAPTTAHLTIAGASDASDAGVWTVTADGGAEVVPGANLIADGPGTFTYEMPALSVSVIVPGATAPPPQ